MLWEYYVFRRGTDVYTMWDLVLDARAVRLLYIAGRGFDFRAQEVMNAFVGNVVASGHNVEKAELLLVGFNDYVLGPELNEATEKNAKALESTFRALGRTTQLTMGGPVQGEDDISASSALALGTENLLSHVRDHTDIVLDVSSLPRVAYLAILTTLLRRLVPDKEAPNALLANRVNFQVLAGEDASLDAKILSEDPSNDLVVIPGYSSALYAESYQDWPLVWFPILGENRVPQLEKVMRVVPDLAEVCPVLPHPSRDPRRADRLLVEYKAPLLDRWEIPTSNILYAHEAHPFEAYRQLLGAMRRYRKTLAILGGSRLLVTPLGSKLITVGAGLACFEMRPSGMSEDYGVALCHAEPKRYSVPLAALGSSTPEISALLLTGEAYDQAEPPPTS